MKHYAVYHNPDKMPHVAEFPPFLALTRKAVPDVLKSRVWVITGEGHPRSFLLRSYFSVDDVGPGSHGLNYGLSGTAGKEFKPVVRLNDLEWFDDFKRTQQNFRFGFHPITEPRFIEGLEVAASGAEQHS